MPSETTFFDPRDRIDINTLLTLVGNAVWELQGVAPTKTKERASGLGRTGDEKAFAEHNPLDSVTLTYKNYNVTALAKLKIPIVGTIAETYHIDSVTLKYDAKGWPELSVAVHTHLAGKTHLAASCRTYTSKLVFPAQFGIPALISDNTSPTPVKQMEMKSLAVAMRSLSYSLTCTHLDETGGTGDWHAGENHDGVETLDIEFTGVPDATDLIIDATWSNMTDTAPESNTAANTRSVNLVRHISSDAA